MENIAIAAQLIIAVSIVIVWVFRFDNIVVEFKLSLVPVHINSLTGWLKYKSKLEVEFEYV